jgi:hypothetical protein
MTLDPDHTVLPAYSFARWEGDELLNRDAPVKWSNDLPPPAIGTKVHVTMNRLGTGVVRGYFVECGWLGLLVEFLNPPEWYVKQNSHSNPLGHVFGAEFQPAA